MSSIDPKIFKAYDIRGVVGRDFDEEGARVIGSAFGTYLLDRDVGRAVMGRDVRPHSPGLTRAFREGLTAAGVDVVSIGV